MARDKFLSGPKAQFKVPESMLAAVFLCWEEHPTGTDSLEDRYSIGYMWLSVV